MQPIKSINKRSSIDSKEKPRVLGYSFPAEWQTHEATWLTWPVPHVVWGERLEATRQEFAALVVTIAQFEPINLIVSDTEALEDARQKLFTYAERYLKDRQNIHFHELPVDDCWLRDNGPLFIKDMQGQVAVTNWEFNAWGGEYEAWDLDNAIPSSLAQKLNLRQFASSMILEGGAIDVNDSGTCLTTKSCLLNPNRNPDLLKLDIEAYLYDYLGLKRIIWLEQGFQDDETDGHIDLVARFVNNDTVVCTVSEDKTDLNYHAFQANFEKLQSEGLNVIALPVPKRKILIEGEYAPLSYANFYIGNGFVVVPTYSDANDDKAIKILRSCFVDREVIGLAAESMITGGGSFHCVTQQQVKASL